MKNIIRLLLLVILYYSTVVTLFAYNLKKITGKEKLSSSYVNSLCQDDNGVLWIGTINGLNTYNGREITPYFPTSDENILSGNFINKIVYTGDNICWIQNYNGLNKFNTKTYKPIIYHDFNKKYFIEKDINNHLFVINDNDCIYYLNKQSNVFKKIKIQGLELSNIIDFFIDNKNNAWVAFNNGYYFCYKIIDNKENGEISIIQNKSRTHFVKQLKSCYSDGNCINSINYANELYSYNLSTGIEKLIFKFKNEILSKGKIKAVLKYKNRFFVGFESGGILLLEKKKELDEYSSSILDINCGIAFLRKDRFQDVLWIGTDGQGLYQYSETAYSIKSNILNNETYKLEKTVRALCIDKEQALWIGTKGDGILKIHKYSANKNIYNCQSEIYSTENSLLNSNTVYCFKESKKNYLWIGNEEGLNYYSYKDRKIKPIELKIDGVPFKYIHDIYEDNQGNLWLCSFGLGIVKAQVTGTENVPVLKILKHIILFNNVQSSNYFFSIYPENDSILWFSNKGHGAFKYNTRSGKLDSLMISTIHANKTIQDVFFVIKDKSKNYIIGTGFGMIKYDPSGKFSLFNKRNGFLNKTVRAILQGSNDGFWLSTNRDIVFCDAEKNLFHVFESEYGENVSEFGDGAAFKDEKTHTLLFGGINGFVSIVENNISDKKYLPPISFNKLSLFGERHNLYDFISREGNDSVLNLKYNQNFFSITFTAVDYLNGDNYTYYYKLNGLSNQWINNELSNNATFTNISPGNYTLQVKYFNRTDGTESQAYSLKIHVKYPWYLTFWAFCFYTVSLIGISIFIFRYILLRIKHKEQERLNEFEIKHQKEVFESKLAFFTNITHEFSAPLTLISGPCERILAIKEVNSFVVNYVKMIKSNANRLNALIQELIEFRKIETENRNLQIESIEISELIRTILESFDVLAESKKINFEKVYTNSICWNSDKGFFSSILINLLSNAFKYTHTGENIKLDILVSNKQLIIKIKNDGFINEKDFERIFDPYTILENFEKKDNQQFLSRTGLGLAIAFNMVKLLKGTIHVENTLDNCILFTVCLPFIELTFPNVNNVQRYIPSVDIPLIISHEDEFDRLKPTLLIIDDDIEMLWLISDIFSEQYNTIWLQDAVKIDQKLKEFYPNLIICDVMMPGLDGINLTRKIKKNKNTNHIPIILVSAKHEIQYQIEALSAGAEMYITKPFDTEFLRVSVNQLFERKEKFKDYLSSPISSYDLADGKLTHLDHKKFIMSVLSVINDHITDKDLSPKFIADKLGIGYRSLYRKMEEIGDQNPSTLIRDCRITLAKNLLIKTTLNIDEIVFKSGFSNRASFYRIFNSKFDCTPKEYRQRNNDAIVKS